MPQEQSYILRVSCPDQIGLVSKITSILLNYECNVVSNHEFVDPPTSKFFMRTVFEGVYDPAIIKNEVRLCLGSNATIDISQHQKKKIVILATKEAHVVGDLLIRSAYDDLPANIVAVVSNYDILRPLIEGFKLPFHHISTLDLSREQHEAKLLQCLQQYTFDYLVLAKYMRILNGAFVAQFPNRIINIHHSFLPAFVGSNPYRQAYERGVKVIGATAHFVNDQLDEGPIITQGVEVVDHSIAPKDLVKVGRDVEKTTLAKALDLVCTERVFLAGKRTIVF